MSPTFTAKVLIWTIIVSIVVIGMVWVGRIAIGFGPGAFRRHVTLSGLYTVCKPDGYPLLCALDSDSKDGGLSCIAYNGECK